MGSCLALDRLRLEKTTPTYKPHRFDPMFGTQRAYPRCRLCWKLEDHENHRACPTGDHPWWCEPCDGWHGCNEVCPVAPEDLVDGCEHEWEHVEPNPDSTRTIRVCGLCGEAAGTAEP